jgi:acetyl-CoA carboxylase carboxyl transferase subunit alpha
MDALIDFEKPIAQLEGRLKELQDLAKQGGVDFSEEISALERKVEQLVTSTFAKLSPWQRVQLSRHPQRPHALDYMEQMFPGAKEIHGDRCFADDAAIIVALSSITLSGVPYPLMVIGQEKGRTTKQKMERNFGMVKPEGYRKVMRAYDLAQRFNMLVLNLIDTPGAYPGIQAEERGQAHSIAECIERGFELNVPLLSVVIGEGGSGGALAMGVADEIWMQEYSNYSVISPESCASILWSDSSLAAKASEKLRCSGQDLERLGVIHGLVPEPLGGAHRNPNLAAHMLKEHVEAVFERLIPVWKEGRLLKQRVERFRALGLPFLAETPKEAS